MKIELVLEQHQLLGVIKDGESFLLPDVQEEIIVNQEAILFWKEKDDAACSVQFKTLVKEAY